MTRAPQTARRSVRMSMNFQSDEIAVSLSKLEQFMQKNARDVGNALARGGMLISTRGVEIIKEKGHVVTGTLWRSVHVGFPGAQHGGDFGAAFGGANLASAAMTNAHGEQAQVGPSTFQVHIGSWIYYAYFVERLPDGGFMYPAFKQRSESAMNYTIRLISIMLESELSR